MRRNHRPDNNAAELVKAARKAGMLVCLTGRPTDAFVYVSGRWYPTEIKAAKGAYTPAQEKFIEACNAHNAPMLTWRSVEDVLSCVGGRPDER